MEEEITIKQFRNAIKALPSDKPSFNEKIWYLTQKQHWLGWLAEYESPGAYGRKTGVKRTAKYAYNHIVCPQMLIYLARAIPVNNELLEVAEVVYAKGGATMMNLSGNIRKVVPWSEIYQALWGIKQPPILKRIRTRIDILRKEY